VLFLDRRLVKRVFEERVALRGNRFKERRQAETRMRAHQHRLKEANIWAAPDVFENKGPTIRKLAAKTKPFGEGTMEVESLCSYFLRLAEYNGLIPGALAKIVWSVLPDGEARSYRTSLAVQVAACQGSVNLDPLEGAVRVTKRSLSRHALFPIFRHFIDREPSHFELDQFMGKLEFRVCPLCLKAPEPYYRLVWTLHQVTICMSHGVHLTSHCHKCQRKLKPLTNLSILGRCDQCRAFMKDTKPVAASELDMIRQQKILTDYSMMLTINQSCRVAPFDRWWERLRAIRIENGMSVDDLARITNTSADMISAMETNRRLPPLQILLSWIRALSGSVKGFLNDPVKI